MTNETVYGGKNDDIAASVTLSMCKRPIKPCLAITVSMQKQLSRVIAPYSALHLVVENDL